MSKDTPTPAPAPMTARLRELEASAAELANKLADAAARWRTKEFDDLCHANTGVIIEALRNAPTILRLLEAVDGMEKAIEPFRGAYDVKPPTADKWPDDKPLHECLPGIWPTWGDLKRLRKALATLRAAREVKP